MATGTATATATGATRTLVAIVVFSVVVIAVLSVFLRRFPLGRRIYAVGSNPLASEFYGLRIERVTLFAYALSGVLCGLAGLLYAARVGTVTVVLASGWELSSLAAAVIGGVSVAGGSGTVSGAALGALILAAIVLAVAIDVMIGAQIRRSLQGRRLGGLRA